MSISGEIYHLRTRLATVEAERDALIAGQSQLYAKIEEAAKDAQRLEAERDAARATYICFHCGFASADEAEATAHFGDRDEEMPLCRWWRDSTDAERAQELQSKILELTSVTDERDNALRYTELLIAERDAARAEAAEVIEHYGDPEEDETLAEVVDRINKNAEEGWGRAGDLQAALESAQAGEARAMLALHAFCLRVAFIGHPGERFWDTGDGHMIPDWRDELRQSEQATAGHEPALAWLAQQRGEAVAAWIEKQVAENLERYGTHYYERTTDDLMREAAALRAGATGGADA